MEEHNELKERLLNLILREIQGERRQNKVTEKTHLLMKNDSYVQSVAQELLEKYYSDVSDIEVIIKHIDLMLIECSKIVNASKLNEGKKGYGESKIYNNDETLNVILVCFVSLDSEFNAIVNGRLVGTFINGQVTAQYLCHIVNKFNGIEEEKYKLLYLLMQDKDKIYHIEYIEKKLAIHDAQNHLQELDNLDLVTTLDRNQTKYMISHKGEIICNKVLQGLKPY